MQCYDARVDDPLSRFLKDFRTTVHADTVVVARTTIPADDMSPIHALSAFAVALGALGSIARSSWEQAKNQTRSAAVPATALPIVED